MCIRTFTALFLCLAALSVTSFAATNEITIHEADGAAKTNYPIVIGRCFKYGEIKNYPVAVYSGSNITTQANVKTRWSDGSVKHAIISFLVDLSSDQTKTISFGNQAVGNDTALTESEMLHSNYDFDAVVSADFGAGAVETSARTMLDGGFFTSFSPGIVANQIVIADHSASRAYDFGSDVNKSLRPVFVATFFPTINKVKVRFVVENSSTEVLQDQTYDIVLKTRDSIPATVYTRSGFLHTGGSRWSKEFWIGEDPGNVDVNHNAAYLGETGQIHTFRDLTISESTISTNYSSWLASDKDIGSPGNLTKDGGATGLRPEIGPYPRWHVMWLLSGDHRMREVALGNADLAARWPKHFREGDASKYLDRSGEIPGIGRVLSVSKRPTISLCNGYNYASTLPNDRVTTVGTVTTDGWVAESSHQGDYYSLAYVLTGDYWYLEQGLFYASYNAAYTNGAAYNYNYGRGPTGAEGGVGDQLRGEAWTLKQKASMEAITPDDMPEKALLKMWIDDFIAIEEGRLNIQSTNNYGNALWNWGRNIRGGGLDQPPLHQWKNGATAFAQADYGIDTTVTNKAISQFEMVYMLIAIGRVKDLGHVNITPIFNYLKRFYDEAVANDFNLYLLANGRLPTNKKPDDSFFLTYASLETGYDCAVAACDHFYVDPGYYWSYAFALRSGLSFLDGESTAASYLYDFIDNELYVVSGDNVEVNPQWALAPYAGGPSINGKRYHIKSITKQD